MIELDLLNLNANYLEEEQEVFKKYLDRNYSTNIINEIVAILCDEEFIYYTDDNLVSRDIYRTPYRVISEDGFRYLKNQEIIQEDLDYSSNMYINFHHENNEYVNKDSDECYLKNNIPGLFHFNDNIITYYFLDGNEGYLNPDNTRKYI